MYDEFPIIYETTLGLKWNYFILFGVIGGIILIILLISLERIFKKANRSGVSAFIPFYNLNVLLEITNSSKWNFLFLFIPGINLAFYIILMLSLAKCFRKTKVFALGLIFLPFVFYPILGFGDSEYIGMNLVAMERKSNIIDIPKIVENDEQTPVIHEDKDTNLRNINISIGGGVYQKNYTSKLLQVDKKQIISEEPSITNQQEVNSKKSLNDNVNSTNLSFIPPIRDEIGSPEKGAYDTTKNQMNMQKQESLCNNIKETPFVINSEVQSLADNQSQEKSDFISCPRCGAIVKSDTGICFLCGKKLG